MTDTEAKALAWATQWESKFVTPYPPGRKAALVQIFTEQLRAQEATEARHAAEMRELKERFSEAAARTNARLDQAGYHREAHIRQDLAPFIISAPDPLVEAISGCGWLNSESMAEQLRAAIEARGGRIVWEAGE